MILHKPYINTHCPEPWKGGAGWDRAGLRKGHSAGRTVVWGSGKAVWMEQWVLRREWPPGWATWMICPGSGQLLKTRSAGLWEQVCKANLAALHPVLPTSCAQGGAPGAAGHGPPSSGSTFCTTALGEAWRLSELKDAGAGAVTPEDGLLNSSNPASALHVRTEQWGQDLMVMPETLKVQRERVCFLSPKWLSLEEHEFQFQVPVRVLSPSTWCPSQVNKENKTEVSCAWYTWGANQKPSFHTGPWRMHQRAGLVGIVFT